MAARQCLSRSYARYIAEFLNEGSPVHLRLLASTTGVGLRYGYHFLSHVLFWSVYSLEFRILLQFYLGACAALKQI